MKNLLKKQFGFKIKEVNEEEYTIKAIFSTPDEDRHGEIVDQAGWDLKDFMSNPVILFGHDQWTPAIGKVLNLGIVDGNLEGTIQFAVKEDKSGLAETIFNLYKNKFMRAFSVGFENTKYEYNEDTDQITLKENILYEISAVNVPANARALAYQKGIDLEPLNELTQKANAEKARAEKAREEKKTEAMEKNIADRLEKNITKLLRADNGATKKIKVETPKKATGGKYSARDINKAIRRLQKLKKLI